MAPLSDSEALGGALVTFAADRLEALLAGPLRGWRVPRVWGGHRVGADVVADLAFTIAHLRAAGVREVGAAPIDGALQIVLRQVDGPGTHTFFSYRVAETLLPHGPFADNHLLAGWTAAERENLRIACDSTDWIGLLGHGVPRNYHAVLARCELGRARLGLVEGDGPHLEALVSGTRDLLAENPRGFLDDALTRLGRYDIYTADVHLFCEPLADRLGEPWEVGMRAALDLVRRTASPDGSAVGWGRSTGVLAVCLTAELAALAVDRAMTDEPGAWLALAGAALDALPDWFDDEGVVTAHVDRSPYYYRGPARRLQMTLDCLGKIAEAGGRLLALGEPAEAIGLDEALTTRDEWIPFDDRHAGAWVVRTPSVAFTLPVTGSTVNDYLPSPRQPQRLEVPVQDPLPCGTPAVWVGDAQHAGGGLPSELVHGDGELRLVHDGFPKVGRFEADDAEPFPGRREVTWRVEGRSIVAHERWRFDTVPDALAWQWAEVPGVPVSLRVESAAPHRIDTVDVAGLKEWRSFWNPLPRVHQVDLEPASEVEATFRLTTKLRVASTAYGHHYHRELYRSLRDEVDDRESPWHPLRDDDPSEARALDLFHLHWPEWVAFDDLDAHDAMIATLREAGVPIVWTQHNLTPHAKQPELFDAVYERWARAADGVIHHTEWGRELVMGRYPFRGDALHRVIRHGHWGRAAAKVAGVTRADVEAELGLEPCAVRFGIVGAPRKEKRVEAFMEGFSRSRRDDAELVVWSLDDGERVPDDPRIRAEPYDSVDRATYDRRLLAVDVLVLPFTEGMLATGTVGDAIGHGLATMASDWGFLRETFGDAAIPCPLEPDDVAAAVDGLSDDDVRRSAAAVAALREPHDWATSAAATLELFDALPRPPRRL